MTYTCRIIHSRAHNSHFLQPLLRSSESFHLWLAETDLSGVGGIFTECLVHATSCIRARDKLSGECWRGHGSALIYCTPRPERFRFKSLLISIQAPPPRTPVSEIGLFKISVHTRRDDRRRPARRAVRKRRVTHLTHPRDVSVRAFQKIHSQRLSQRDRAPHIYYVSRNIA